MESQVLSETIYGCCENEKKSFTLLVQCTYSFKIIFVILNYKDVIMEYIFETYNSDYKEFCCNAKGRIKGSLQEIKCQGVQLEKGFYL